MTFGGNATIRSARVFFLGSHDDYRARGNDRKETDSRNVATPTEQAKPARDERVEYAMRPTTWDYYFSFRVSDPKSHWDSGPYSQLATLSLKGDLIRPADPVSNMRK
jgi:hypothetical protein